MRPAQTCAPRGQRKSVRVFDAAASFAVSMTTLSFFAPGDTQEPLVAAVDIFA
jgi:hypothetical protein